MRMFRTVGYRTVLCSALLVMVIALFGLTFMSRSSLNDASDRLIQDLYRENLVPNSLILNADRDMYQGLLAKRNILIVGKTGSGKTTITKSLIEHIPRDERLVTIEDVHELFMRDVPNKVHLFYARDDEGGSRVTPKQALASCLRMKPDRILLAELRGDEAWEFIKSINTGHPGSISTMHANGAFEAFEQLTAFIKDSKTGSHLDTDYIKHRLFTTIDVVLFYDKWKLREIYYEPENKRKQLG